MAESEIAQLKLRIAEEYQAARLGLSGLAAGSSRHAFIEAKINCVGVYQEQLVQLLGRDPAMAVVLEAIDQAEHSCAQPGLSCTESTGTISGE